MITAPDWAWPIATLAMRTLALLAITSVLILVVLPAAFAAAGPPVPIGG